MGLSANVVLFDLDGTLTDSLPGIADALRHVLAPLGLSVDDQTARTLIGPPLRDALRTVGVEPSDLDATVDAYRAYFSDVGMYNNRLYDGVREMLDTLRDRGAVLGVATSKFTGFAERILDHFDVSDYFTTVSGTTQDRAPLSKSEIVRRALSEVAVARQDRIVMVGDTAFDMAAALTHDLGAIGVTWGYGEPGDLLAAGAEHLVATPNELTTLLL